MEEQDKGLPVSFRLPSSIVEDAKRVAEKKMTSVTTIVKTALTEYIDRELSTAEVDFFSMNNRLVSLEEQVKQLNDKYRVLVSIFKSVSSE